ncbi:MAG: sialidase family protein [Nannocystaceae bacterium]
MPVASIGVIAYDPLDPETIYVGTGEPTCCSCCYYGLGVYKSVDGGETWQHCGEDVFAGRSVRQIAVSRSTGEVWASVTESGEPKEHRDGAEEGGLFRSSDGGETWGRVNGLPAIDVSDFAFAPDVPHRIYVGVQSPVQAVGPPEAGLYRSTDGGDTWTKLDSGFTSEPNRIVIAISQVDPQRLYVVAGGAKSSVYVSSDGGDNWTSRRPGGFGPR